MSVTNHLGDAARGKSDHGNARGERFRYYAGGAGFGDGGHHGKVESGQKRPDVVDPAGEAHVQTFSTAAHFGLVFVR